MYIFHLPEPLSDKLALVLLDLAVLSDFSLLEYFCAHHELILRPSHLLINAVLDHSEHLSLLCLPSFVPFRRFHRLPPISRFRYIQRRLHSHLAPSSHANAPPTPFSSSASIVGKKQCNASPSTPVWGLRLIVRDDSMGGILPSMVSLRSAGKAGPSKFADLDAGSASPSICCCSRSCSESTSCVSSLSSDNAPWVSPSCSENASCVSCSCSVSCCSCPSS